MPYLFCLLLFQLGYILKGKNIKYDFFSSNESSEMRCKYDDAQLILVK